MPHKKNPDVFELIRAKCNKIQSLANEVTLITNNLPSGYFRDFQVIKESYLQSFDYLIDCIDITAFVLPKIHVKDKLLTDDKYKYVFSVEEVNREVQNGIPFRDAYKLVADKIQSGSFNPTLTLNHTHEGSIGNLCNEQIKNKFVTIVELFNKSKIERAEKKLLN
jgi:argininosuccinate lyase